MDLKGKIVFSSGRTADFDIWTLDIQSGTLAQLTHGNELNDMPRWSPDGSQICFIRTSEDLIASLYVMDADGKNVKQLSKNCHAQHPSWSPDGSRIVFTANAGENKEEVEICTCDASTGEVSVLLDRKGQETEPSLSPDGSKLLFSSIDPNCDDPFSHRDTEIWEYDLNKKTERKLCAHPARDFSPVYSPDGSQIAFVSHRNGASEEEYMTKLQELHNQLDVMNMSSVENCMNELRKLDKDGEIYVVDIDGSNLRQLTNNTSAEMSVRWSPCGKYLVYSSYPKDQHEKQRLKVLEVATGKESSLAYDRNPLMKEINADPNKYLNQRWFQLFVPDCLEKPFMMRVIGSMYWGEERWPDWSDKA